MERSELFAKIEIEISQSQLRYEADRDNAHLSTIRVKELETLQNLYDRLKSGEEAEALLNKLKEDLPELEEMKEQEFLHPSFDWYDEHYHYKVLDGRCDAYRIMIKLLEQE